jgi:hypothetical protein
MARTGRQGQETTSQPGSERPCGAESLPRGLRKIASATLSLLKVEYYAKQYLVTGDESATPNSGFALRIKMT